MIIKILGAGCTKCKTLEQRLIALKDDQQLDFELEKVTQLADILSYGIMTTPGLVIDEKVMCTGKLPSEDEIVSWIKESH